MSYGPPKQMTQAGALARLLIAALIVGFFVGCMLTAHYQPIT